MKIVVLIALVALTGCGVAERQTTRANYARSLDVYRSCVQANGAEGCQRQKAILDADAEAYTNARNDVNVNVRQR